MTACAMELPSPTGNRARQGPRSMRNAECKIEIRNAEMQKCRNVEMQDAECQRRPFLHSCIDAFLHCNSAFLPSCILALMHSCILALSVLAIAVSVEAQSRL